MDDTSSLPYVFIVSSQVPGKTTTPKPASSTKATPAAKATLAKNNKATSVKRTRKHLKYASSSETETSSEAAVSRGQAAGDNEPAGKERRASSRLVPAESKQVSESAAEPAATTRGRRAASSHVSAGASEQTAEDQTEVRTGQILVTYLSL